MSQRPSSRPASSIDTPSHQAEADSATVTIVPPESPPATAHLHMIPRIPIPNITMGALCRSLGIFATDADYLLDLQSQAEQTTAMLLSHQHHWRLHPAETPAELQKRADIVRDLWLHGRRLHMRWMYIEPEVRVDWVGGSYSMGQLGRWVGALTDGGLLEGPEEEQRLGVGILNPVGEMWGDGFMASERSPSGLSGKREDAGVTVE